MVNVEEEFPAETDAKGTIYGIIEMLEKRNGQVILPGEEKISNDRVFKNLDDLRDYLVQESDSSFASSIPSGVDWEPDSESWVDEILAEKAEYLQDLGLSE